MKNLTFEEKMAAWKEIQHAWRNILQEQFEALFEVERAVERKGKALSGEEIRRIINDVRRERI